MRPQQLRTLVAAVDAVSLTGAARRLGMSQPGFSHHFVLRRGAAMPQPAATFVRQLLGARRGAELLRRASRAPAVHTGAP